MFSMVAYAYQLLTGFWINIQLDIVISTNEKTLYSVLPTNCSPKLFVVFYLPKSFH